MTNFMRAVRSVEDMAQAILCGDYCKECCEWYQDGLCMWTREGSGDEHQADACERAVIEWLQEEAE